jgi:hypothetical protein
MWQVWGDRRDEYRALVGIPEGKRHLGGSRQRWEDNITMDLQETELVVVDWIDLAQDRSMGRALVNEIMNIRISYNAGNS